MIREDRYKDNQNQQQNQQQNRQTNESQSLADTGNTTATAAKTTSSIVARNDSNMVTAALNSSSSTEESSVRPKSHVVSPNHHQCFKSLPASLKLYCKNHCLWPHCYYRQQKQHNHPVSLITKSHGHLRHINSNHTSIYYQNNIIKRYHHHLHLQHNIKSIHSFKKVLRRFNHKSSATDTCYTEASTESASSPPPPTNWTPPITYDTLKELSVNHIFKSLQLRHDLLFDPNLSFRPNLDGPSGREKRKKADYYWRRVDLAFDHSNDDWIFLKVIIQEICRILVSLMHPVAAYPPIAMVVAGHAALPWYWPSHITKHDIHDVLDSDLIIQQLKYSKQIGNQVDWLKSIFEKLLLQPHLSQQPQHHQHQQHQQATTRLVNTMTRYFSEGRYANALKHCFTILEAIKLDCANRILVHYRNLLIETCAEFEYRCFFKHQHPMDSIDAWLSYASKRFGDNGINNFQPVYYAGLIHLVIDDQDTLNALDIPTAVPWPVTFQFDQKRMTHQFRYEFQHILIMAIMLVPYRHLVGGELDLARIQTLKKQMYVELVQLNRTPFALEGKTYRQLAHYACQTAAATRNQHAMGALDQKTVAFWENWMIQNVKHTSPLFKLMFARLSRQLQYVAQHGKLRPVLQGTAAAAEVMGLEEEIRALGLKLKLVADLNLEAFSKVYNNRLIINKT